MFGMFYFHRDLRSTMKIMF